MSELTLQIQEIVNQDVNLCYQCEKCTSGCPVSVEMKLVPAQIMHAIQLNMKKMILEENTIWLCASCETCTTRCPQGIDISKVMDALRIIARREKVKAKLPLVPAFYNLCLLSLKHIGCIYEVGIAAWMRVKSGRAVADFLLAVAFFKRGRLNPLPSFRKTTNIKKIIKRVKKYEGV